MNNTEIMQLIKTNEFSLDFSIGHQDERDRDACIKYESEID